MLFPSSNRSRLASTTEVLPSPARNFEIRHILDAHVQCLRQLALTSDNYTKLTYGTLLRHRVECPLFDHRSS